MKANMLSFKKGFFLQLLRFSKFILLKICLYKDKKILMAFQIGSNSREFFRFYLLRIQLVEKMFAIRFLWFGFSAWHTDNNEDTGQYEPNRGFAFYGYFGDKELFMKKKKWLVQK